MVMREQTIFNCFQSWIKKDDLMFADCFASSAIYIESWGPAYRSHKDIVRWFHDWNSQNKVLQWDIKRFWHHKDTCICEWYFKCKCDENIDGFDGLSIIKFNGNEKIIWLKEFQSKSPNYYPYE